MYKFGIIFVAIAFSTYSFILINTGNVVDPELMANTCQKDTTVPKFGYAFSEEKPKSVNRAIIFNVRGKNDKKTSQTTLTQATTLADIIPNYPSKWINSYTGTEIIITREGKQMRAIGKAEALSKDQLILLKSAGEIEEVLILVNYESENAVTKIMEPHQMKVAMDVEPKTNAQYKGGDSKLTAYLSEGCSSELRTYILKELEALQQGKERGNGVAVIGFTVNENGDAENVTVVKSCGDSDMDMRMLQLIEDMPEWIPAQDEKGKPVSQNFELFAGQAGC